MRILVVEDDEVLSERIAAGLTKQGYTVDTAMDGEEGLDMATMQPYGLVVLDLMLPKRDGWSVCESLRSAKNGVPILMLTARDEIEDRVRGLETGADDYLPKPFDFRELLARVRALTRRDQVHRRAVIRIADLEIDTGSKRVLRGGVDIRLTPHEYVLLEALARNEGRTLSRETILERIWDDEESLPNTVSFHIASLRKKVDAGPGPRLIHTVHGLGYVLRVEG